MFDIRHEDEELPFTARKDATQLVTLPIAAVKAMLADVDMKDLLFRTTLQHVPEPDPTFDYVATIGVVGDSPSFEITIVARNIAEALRKALEFAHNNGGCDDRVLTIGQVMPCYTLPNGKEVGHE